MSEKLREQTIETQLEFVEWLKEKQMYNLHASASQMQAMHDVWERMRTPEHETVEQWEERTGETYPDDGPVYVWTVNNPTCRKRWRLMEYNYSKSYRDVCEIIVANHHGKPEKEKNNG